MRITKKLKQKLHTELCMNDVLFEIHKRNMGQLNREAKRLIHDRKRINMENQGVVNIGQIVLSQTEKQ